MMYKPRESRASGRKKNVVNYIKNIAKMSVLKKLKSACQVYHYEHHWWTYLKDFH